MWMFSKSDLKYRLTLRVIAVSVLCFAAASAYFVLDTDRTVRARVDALAGITAKTLELQRGKIQWINNPRAEFPDLQVIAASIMAPGLCIAYRTSDGEMLQRFCGGPQSDNADVPWAFAVLYRWVFDPGREAVRPVLFGGAKIGEAVASVDSATLIAEAWHQTGRLLAVVIVTLPLLFGLVYAALARALRPTQAIRAGLERIAANDLSTRLPPFDLAELSAVRDVFNHLAESLAGTLAQRNELTRKLIALQDDERRHLARELHDEFGQSLTAIRALAASAKQGAERDCPALLPECDSIARTTAEMMETLRGALFRLRPPDVEELGLAASVEGLIAGWNRLSRGQPRFEMRVSGYFESLPAALGANVYGIAQEAITNAAKHSGATRISLHLTMRQMRCMQDGGGGSEIELVVEDDGQVDDHRPVKSGMGLLGMRERVAMLGGRLSFAPERSRGSILRVTIPAATASLPQVLKFGVEFAA